MPSPTNRRLAAFAAAAALALTVTACADKDDSPAEPAAGDPPTSSAPVTPEPTEPDPTPSSEPTETAAPPATGLAALLLPTGSVPGLNATWKWQDGRTGKAPATAFGPCAKVDLASIGAGEVVQRTYFPPVDTDDNAAEQVAAFVDAKSTTQAASVLRSWYAKCPTRIEGAAAKKGPITPVTVGTGTAYWYLVTLSPPNSDEGRFVAVGTVVSGTRVAVLTMTSFGQDYNYPAGKEPMVRMVQAAASNLG